MPIAQQIGSLAAYGKVQSSQLNEDSAWHGERVRDDLEGA